MRNLLGVTLLAAGLAGAPALAQETTSYTYDALGRLTQTSTTGSINSGVVKTYGFDAADNRTQVVITGASDYPRSSVIVVPLNGLTIIPLR